ncbi:lipopolysaccharide core heptose(II) kinase RfaY [Caulobacter endophyticus]|uniref:NERD domain-containing protein n=1 Tax=Caulobacter endophyticus TaxID=2172652 RepID=A0A2T9JEJ8_9CAUL|nr:lipopolysaccharide core heptose(II) kinase RfaY [Caulobacter endophyticus]PVM82098.1 hypothetical protein DDF67_24105 [Caulobacter endophyticus]
MACRVQYLSSAGIQRREVKGVESLATALPINWMLFASLNAFPKNSSPIEIDLLCVMDDRVVLLELKDWNGKLTSNGDNWLVNGSKRGRSAVILGNEKAKKVKGIISNQIPQLSGVYVDSRVVLTATATRDALPHDEKPFVLTLQEACLLGNRTERNRLLGNVKMLNVRPNMFVKDFEKLVKSSSYFQPLKMSWDGYGVTDEDFFVHRSDIWREHRAHLSKEERVKALLRLWRFDNLPAGLNEPEGRALIADRELGVLGHLGEQQSWMAQRGILKPIGSAPDEVLTQHHQLLSVPNGWTTLRRYLERNGEELTGDQLIDLVHSLVSMVAELHRHGVAHRDIGGDCVWLGDPTSMAMTGFYSARLPNDQSVGDWLDILAAYAEKEPHWGGTQATARERDVRSVGLLMRQIEVLDASRGLLPPGWGEVADKALAAPGDRYNSAIDLAEAIGELRTPSGPDVDQSRLDAFETKDIPYAVFPPAGPMTTNPRLSRYESGSTGSRLVVKVWNGMQRGDARRDHALLAMLEAAASLQAVPASGCISVVRCGLSPVGPFVVTEFVDGGELVFSPEIGSEERLAISSSLISAVTSLHARGLGHGDLHPGNVIVSNNKVTLIDLFDVSPLGAGRLHSFTWAPENYERLSFQQIDRFAACKMILSLVEGDPNLATIVTAAKAELAREAIETLLPLSELVDLERRRLSLPPPAHFEVSGPSLPTEILKGDEGRLWVKAFRTADGLESFFLAGLTARLLVRVNAGSVHVELTETQFRDLAQGTPVELAVSTTSGESRGALELADFLRAAVAVEEAPAASTSLADPPDVDQEEEPAEEDEAGEYDSQDLQEPKATAASTPLNVPRMWLRASEIEDEIALQVRLDRRLPDSGSSATFQYETPKPLEFDDDDTVEVRLDGVRGRRLGTLDLLKCDDHQLAIRDLRDVVLEGESVTLVDRRDRVSKERRRRAVERVTDRRSVIPDLIDFFDPTTEIPTTTFSLEVSDAELKAYGLNEGQGSAFRHLLRAGPVGLLQGPPGSGKTRFIAAFTHWLLKRGGARRVLIASQSHEAVNNVLEELLRTYRVQGGHAELLRVGARGATERIRPYQAKSLRERYRVRFENGLKTRVAHAAGAMGISRQFVHDVVDVDTRLGAIQRSLELAIKGAEADQDRDERRRSESRIRTLLEAFAAVAKTFIGRDVEAAAGETAEIVEEAFQAVLNLHPKSSPGDLSATRKLLKLSHEWRETLGSGHRNFDEFLAKTRNVVAGTCVGLGQSQIRLEESSFDWVIVDEAARCTSGELAVPLQMGSRVVLVGDQLQLRPMVDREVQTALREEFKGPAKQALALSDFERAFASEFGRQNARVLDEQYRMAPAISDMVSEIFYRPHGVQLRPSDARKPDAAFASLAGPLAAPITWFDTTGMPGCQERDRNNGREVWNDAEIETVLSILAMIASEQSLADDLGRRAEPTIGVICMYSEQKRRLDKEWSQRPFSEAFRRTVTIDTVDAYQGKENAIVIVSLVRSNSERRPYHVGRENRCNVALSRAKERLYIVGDTAMWGDVRNSSPMRQVLARIRCSSSDVAIVSPAGSVGR